MHPFLSPHVHFISSQLKFSLPHSNSQVIDKFSPHKCRYHREDSRMQQSSHSHTHKQNDQSTDDKCLNKKDVTTLKLNGTHGSTLSLPCPPLISMITHGDLDKSDLCELRNRMISQKWLLSRWVTLKERELESKCKNIASELKLFHRNASTPGNDTNISSNGLFDNLTNLIASKSKRVKFTGGINCHDDRESIRYGPCCFSTEDSNDCTIECHKPALPFTRHCKKHILYNVDQLLFERCAAKSTTSPLTQCSNATFCIEKDRKPLCTDHQRLLLTSGILLDDDKEVSTTVTGKGRKRPKSNLVTRSTRRKTNAKGKGKGKGDSLETVSASSTVSNHCDSSTANYNLIHVELMNNHSHTVTNVPPLHPVDTTNHDSSSNTYPLGVDPNGDIPTGLDVDIHNLTAGDEALVASLVEDLPPLGTSADEVVVGDANSSHAFDAEFNEVLNKLPPEAFNEIFSTATTDNHHVHSLVTHTTPQATITDSLNVSLTPVTSHHTHQLHHQRSMQPATHLMSTAAGHHAVNKVPNSDSTIDSIVMDVDSNLFSPRVNSQQQHPHSQQQQQQQHLHHHHHSHHQQHHHQLSHSQVHAHAQHHQHQQHHPLSNINHPHQHHHPSHHHSSVTQNVLKDCTSIANGNDCTFTGYLPSNVVQNNVVPSLSPCSNGMTSSNSSNASLVVHSHVSDVNSVVNAQTQNGNNGTTVAVNAHRIVSSINSNNSNNNNNSHNVVPSNLANLLMSRSMSINSSVNLPPPSAPSSQPTQPASSTTPVATVSPVTASPVTVASGVTLNSNTASVSTLPQVNDDLCGLATNILGCLTKEQQQQLNGLIDGALASGSLSSSPTLKHAPVSLDANSFTMTSSETTSSHLNHLSTSPESISSVSNAISILQQTNITSPGPDQLLTSPSSTHHSHMTTTPVIANGTLIYKTGNILGNTNQ